MVHGTKVNIKTINKMAKEYISTSIRGPTRANLKMVKGKVGVK